MELPAPEEDDRRLHTFVQGYGEMVRDGLVFLAYTVLAVLAMGIAFLILKVAWSLLLLALRALGEI